MLSTSEEFNFSEVENQFDVRTLASAVNESVNNSGVAIIRNARLSARAVEIFLNEVFSPELPPGAVDLLLSEDETPAGAPEQQSGGFPAIPLHRDSELVGNPSNFVAYFSPAGATRRSGSARVGGLSRCTQNS